MAKTLEKKTNLAEKGLYKNEIYCVVPSCHEGHWRRYKSECVCMYMCVCTCAHVRVACLFLCAVVFQTLLLSAVQLTSEIIGKNSKMFRSMKAKRRKSNNLLIHHYCILNTSSRHF